MQPGTELGHYRILASIGEGGMGEVWKARDTNLGREVAIKFVHPRLAAGAHAVERLRIEARAASGMNHPNICTIYDLSEHEGSPFIVMELMKGKTLQECLKRGPMKITEVVDLGIQIADALVAAHARGIIHRDIKPANLFITDTGLVKIMDFGLAKLLPEHHGLTSANSADTVGSTGQLTTSGATVGTVSYMSPEQASGEELDGRTDLFSLGIVLYQLATGQAPFQGKTSAVVLAAILNRAQVSPRAINPEITERLETVINNCLEKDRELRYQAAADLRADLKRAKRDLELRQFEGVQGISPGDSSGSSNVYREARTQTGIPVSPSSDSVRPASRRWPLVAIPVIVMAAIAIVVMVLLPPNAAETEDAGLTADAAPTDGNQETLDRAEASLDAGTYRDALSLAEEVLATNSDQPDAIRIRDTALAAVVRFDTSIADARRWITSGDPDLAGDALEVARGIDPSAPVVSELYTEVVALLDERAARALASPPNPVSPPPPVPPPAPPAEIAPPAEDTAPRTSAVTAAVEDPIPAPAEDRDTGGNPDPPTTVADEVEIEPPAPTSPAPTPEPRGATAESNPTPPLAAAVNSPDVSRDPPPVPVAPELPPAPDEAEVVDAETLIRGVLDDYARAIESENLDLFRRVKPNLSAAESARLSQSFREVEYNRVEFTILSLIADDDTATVRLSRTDTIEVGGTEQTITSGQTVELVRQDDRWVIETIGE